MSGIADDVVELLDGYQQAWPRVLGIELNDYE